MKLIEIFAVAAILIVVLMIGGGITGAIVSVPSTESYSCEKVVYEDKIVTKQVPLSYSVLKSWKSESGWGLFRAKSRTLNVRIKNTDNTGGTFTLEYNINKQGGNSLTSTSRRFIKPYETATISSGGYEFGISNWQYRVIAPTKEKLTTKKVSKKVPSTCTRTIKKSLLAKVFS